jgi:hypothetical protein
MAGVTWHESTLTALAATRPLGLPPDSCVAPSICTLQDFPVDAVPRSPAPNDSEVSPTLHEQLHDKDKLHGVAVTAQTQATSEGRSSLR